MIFAPRNEQKGDSFIQHLKFALVLGVFTFTAVPGQAAQVCETEIQEVLRAVEAGGRGPNLLMTRKDAVENVQFYKQFICSPESSVNMRGIADEQASNVQNLEKLRSEVAMSDPERAARIDDILLHQRAELARQNLVVCAIEANNADKC